ncbi:hypothetical protein [Sphingobacterium puteale]
MGFELKNDKKAFKIGFDENVFGDHGFKENNFKTNIPFGQELWLLSQILV